MYNKLDQRGLTLKSWEIDRLATPYIPILDDRLHINRNVLIFNIEGGL